VSDAGRHLIGGGGGKNNAGLGSRPSDSTCRGLLCCCPAGCQDLFKRITSLSYLGDVRMGLAEDSKKVERIVAGSYSHFKSLYLPLLKVGESRGQRRYGFRCCLCFAQAVGGRQGLRILEPRPTTVELYIT